MSATTISTADLIRQIRGLNHSEKISILEEVVSLIKNESITSERIPLSSLNGLGSEICEDIDIDEFIANERLWD